VFVSLGPDRKQNGRFDDQRHHPAVGTTCPCCGARIGKPCVSTVPLCGVGVTGTPIEGVHAERIAAALEASAA
jgi:hypothetical protein